MSLFSNQYRRRHNARSMHARKLTSLCECSGRRTREHRTPQQCARCGSRIDRRFDDEIRNVAAVSVVIDLPEEDWDYPGVEQD